MEWVVWILIAINLLWAVGLFAGKNWLKARIEKGIQHGFDQKIEGLRSELRKNEETFKSDLGAKEKEITALRDGVLSGRAQRQGLLDKRRMEAVERVWSTVIALGPYKAVAASMATINFDAAARRTPHEPSLRKFFEIIAKSAPAPDAQTNAAKHEQPFISPLAWAYFVSYQTIVLSAYAQLKVLEFGVENAGELLDRKNPGILLKAILPHQSDFIEKRDPSAYFYLLDELESKLLTELTNMLDGKEIDKAALDQSVAIMRMVKQRDAERAEKIAEVGGANP